MAKNASARSEDLLRDMRKVQGRLDRMEGALARDLEGAILKKVDARLENIDARVQLLNSGQSDMVEKRTSELDDKVVRMADEILGVRAQVGAAEERLKGMWDGLEGIKRALAEDRDRGIVEMLESFDATVDAVLDQMKTELQEGLSRIDGIRGLVQERARTQQELRARDAGRAEPSVAKSEGESDDGESDEGWLPEADELILAGGQEDEEFFAEGDGDQDAPGQ